MTSAFEAFQRLGPAAFVLEALIVTIAADALLLGFILLRRIYRKRYFERRDARVCEFRQGWQALVSGELPHAAWSKSSFDRRIVEMIALDAFEAAGPEESARLLQFLRSSGLIESLIQDARQERGWRRRRALVALGRTRAPEGIPILGEALRERDLETRLAALRGLSRISSPEAAEEILTWVGETSLAVPTLPLQNALVHCCRERPRILLPYLQHAGGAVREVLGRVLGEVATPELGAELLGFADDPLDELRAATARALSQAQPALALEVLGGLARDPVWFVRLRAIVSLGKLKHPDVIPFLLRALTDGNRLVRLRAAEGLVRPEIELLPLFQLVVAARDPYGWHAFLTALENVGLRAKLETELATSQQIREQERRHLQEVLRTGPLSAEQLLHPESIPPGRRSPR